MKKQNFRLVLVTWEDAWADTSDGADSLLIRTAGFILRQNKKRLVLIQSFYHNVEEKIVNNYFSIPKGCIVKIEPLTTPKKK